MNLTLLGHLSIIIAIGLQGLAILFRNLTSSNIAVSLSFIALTLVVVGFIYEETLLFTRETKQ